MIKPIDIQEKEFTKAVRGYKEDEVDVYKRQELGRLRDEGILDFNKNHFILKEKQQ